MTGWVAIQRNRTSGAGPKAAVLNEMIARLKQHGLRPRLFARRERLTALLADADRRNELRCIVAAGGDGTVGDVINRHPGLPISVCPLGTENLFARYLGIPRSGRFVADAIAAGFTRTFDLCTLRSTPHRWTEPPAESEAESGGDAMLRFLLMASAGFDADVVHRLHARRRGHIRRLTYLTPLVQAFGGYRYPAVRVFADGDSVPRTASLALVSNLPAYALQMPFAALADGSDGRLDVRLFERPSRRSLLRYGWNVWRGRHESLPDVQSFTARRVRLESDVAVPLQIDGDPAGFTPATIGVLPAALQVIAPAR